MKHSLFALDLLYFDCEIMLESFPGNNQYLAMRVKLLAHGCNRI